MAQSATETIRMLVVSKDFSVVRPLWSIGEANAWQLETASSSWEALERIQSGSIPRMLLLDLPLGDGDSLHVLRWLRRLRPELPIIVLAHEADEGRKNEAIRLGAHDYLVRPFDDAQLETAIRRHLDSRNELSESDFTSEEIERLSDDTFFVGASPVMQKLRAQADLLAQADVPVLILGEPGSGRDTAARLIHKLSVRSGSRFLKVNCGDVPEDVLDVEIFGSERNSPYSDGRASVGKLELCAGGTILLDDIVEMPVRLQEKLLRVLQNKQFQKLGSDKFVAADVRVLAAADVNIERALTQKKLREDLYYRLSAFSVHVPPLRQRTDEIPFLVRHLMHKLAKHYGLPPRSFSPAVLESCQSYAWPGNVRELENFVKRYLMIGDKDLALGGENPKGRTFEGDSFAQTQGLTLVHAVETEPGVSGTNSRSLKSLIQDVKSEAERNAITAALEKTGWNRKAAARLLKVSYRTMLYKIEQYHMSSPDPYPSRFAGNGNGIKGSGKAN